MADVNYYEKDENGGCFSLIVVVLLCMIGCNSCDMKDDISLMRQQMENVSRDVNHIKNEKANR